MLEKRAELIRIKESIKGTTKYAIVIPTFNRPDTLQNTLKSALLQDYKEDYTIVIVDNNPNRGDDTELFMERIVDPRVSYYKNESNVGMVNNWNQCIIAANSEWVVLVHDDDLLENGCLRIIDETIAENPDADAVLPNYVQKGNPFFKDKPIETPKKDYILKSIIHRIIHRNYPIAANLFCDNIYGPPTCGLTLRKKEVIKFGGYTDRCIAADWDFMSNFSRTHKVVKSKMQTGTYLWAINASLKEETMEQIRKDRIAILKDIIEYSTISKIYYMILKKDFTKKFDSKTTERVEFSILYKLIKRYYCLRV